ncbi:alpha/beta hydrolase family protein [Algimonas porphyrae]|uniref:Peptidase S9 n=1 Tax=Algimonas porphyrae TaxID=1128113 RepID=A0ABQ5V0Y6_9PROT|nr:prolyl oligopeptidase family serine peptidase [Algimonas porphyrae]GLQ20829.1 peptidase S9 [Algimonas porphyrae]
MRFFSSVLIGFVSLAAAWLLLAVPAHAAPDTDLFGQLPAAHDAALSPDGSRVAVIRAVDGNYIVQVVSLDGKQSSRADALQLGPGAKPEWVRWANNKRVLVSFWGSTELKPRSTTGSRIKTASFHSNNQTEVTVTVASIFTIDADTLEGQILVMPRGLQQYNNNVLNWLHDDEDHILMQYASDGESQIFPDVRRVHVATGRDKVVHADRDDITDWITTTDGQVIAGVGFADRSGNIRKVIVRDPNSGSFKNMDEYAGLDTGMQIVSGFPDMTRIVVRAYRDKETQGLHVYNLAKQAFEDTLFQDDVYDAGQPIFSRDGSKIVGATHIADTPVRTLLPEYGTVLKEAESQLDGYAVHFIDQSDDGQTILIRVSSPYDPGGLYVYRSGQSFSVLAQNYPGIEPQLLGDVVSVRYTARDGAKIPAYVTLPAGVRDNSQLDNLPFIVLPHGGPYARDYQTFDWLAQLFASQGYGVLQMNFRGSTGYGQTFEQAGRDDWTVIQNDVEDGARYLIEKGYADPDRLCIAGWSFGGYASLMGVANDPDLYQCAIAVAALTDVKDFYQNSRNFAFGRGAAKRFLGGLLEDDVVRRANNPVDRADDINVPVLLAHGTLDSVVNHDQFVLMQRALGSRKGLMELSFKDEDHYFSDQDNRQKLADEMIDFVRDYLGKSKFAAK